MKCPKCGRENATTAQFCGDCGGGLLAAPTVPRGSDKKLVVGLCSIFLGSFGVHKFLLGYNKEGIILALVTVGSLFWLAVVTAIIGIVEGIIYLTKSDEEFARTYITTKRPWF